MPPPGPGDSDDKVDRARRIAAAIAETVPLEPTWSALEFGCGTGQLTWHLADRLGPVTLTDVSVGMLDVARRHALATTDPERFRVTEHDLADAPWPQPVAVVYSAMTLHHIDDTAALLGHLRDSLVPGGWVALADLDADPDNHFHDDDFDGHHGIDRHALVRDLRALGFAEVAERTATTITKTKDGEERTHEVFLVTGRLPA